MKKSVLNAETVEQFRRYLEREEKSAATIEKYIRDVKAFSSYIKTASVTKDAVIGYKQKLLDSGYAIRSVNSMLASLNCLFTFLGRTDLKVKSLKIQAPVFCPEEKELSKAEYERLCRAAEQKHNERLSLILQTICSSGIRVSELRYITAEAVREGKAEVSLKGKTRSVLLPDSLRKKLLRYVRQQGTESGPVFVTRNGKAISRTNIWRDMKSLCEEAGVDPGKVFPHNLRHLFARMFYKLEKDIAKLADVLGHSSVNTTRLYIISSGIEHRHCIEKMQLVI